MTARRRVVIAPSILSADLGRLAEQVREAENAGADWIHVDVMDGRYVPNLTFGPAVLKAVRRATALPLDVHLMIVEPERHTAAFARAGATRLTVHPEATLHLHRTVEQIRDLGVLPGVSLNPASPLDLVEHVLGDLDLVLLMTVNPGFAAQQFIPAMLPKIRALRSRIDERGLDVILEVDGGINEETAPRAVEAGAEALVAGNAIFNGGAGVRANLDRLRRAALAAT